MSADRYAVNNASYGKLSGGTSFNGEREQHQLFCKIRYKWLWLRVHATFNASWKL